MKDRQTENQAVNYKPRCLAQKCPVCNGWGTVSFKKMECHACEGKGYVLIPLRDE